jgi:hypothetical protein
MRPITTGVLLLVLTLLGATTAARAYMHEGIWEPDPRWKYVQLSAAGVMLPIRIVAYDEAWEQVVQDVQARLRATAADREVRVGFYGHGAFVPPAEVQHDILFVAALGLAAEMDGMIFPQWRFPVKNPLRDIPHQILQEQFNVPLKNPVETVEEVIKSKMRQLALDNRFATAHAAVRLAEGIHAFHRRHMTPALAAFSNSAIVLVRLGQLLEQGTLWDGYEPITVADQVRQGVYVSNVVTFGYPLPHGDVSTVLRQRVQGTFTNVVPSQCWKQLSGSFPLRGGVENVAVSWAPFHAGWPQLSPKGSEVAVLGAFLAGRAEAGRLAAQLGQRVQGVDLLTKSLWDAVCAHMPVLDRAVTIGSP